MAGYNGLFKDLSPHVLHLTNELMALKCPVNVGSFITTQNVSYNVRFCTRLALKMFSSRLCCCCESNDLWVVAGGFAAYAVGHTKEYSDVDIFVKCFCALKCQTLPLGYSSAFVNGNVVSLSINNVQLQIIQVPFSGEGKFPDVLDLFASHVLTHFDLPLSRVTSLTLEPESC